MVSVPGFLLRRLYVKQSLRNTTDGFEFELRNRLGSGYAHRLLPLTVDGDELPIGQASFLLDGNETAFADVSKEKHLHPSHEQGYHRARQWPQARARRPEDRDGLRRPRAGHAEV